MGLFYYTKKYYIAASVPNMLAAKHLVINDSGNEFQFGSDKQHFFITSGYVFQMSENIKFKPSFMAKSAFNTPISVDISANTLFFEKLETGVSYRLQDSFGAMVNFAITPNLKIGYAYDYNISKLITTNSSHEFMLLFDLNRMKKVSISPRFF
jgi:type IX secretion system PorP/SprF family membrane protein